MRLSRDAARAYDYAIFVFTPDDLIQDHDKQAAVPRDNVVFEAGLFIGQLTRFKTFVVQPYGKNVQLPTDLNGLTTANPTMLPVIDALDGTGLFVEDGGGISTKYRI